MPLPKMHIEEGWFVDEYGRRVLLRGVNFTASSKLPVSPDESTHVKTDFREHRSVSFIGHPVPLEEAEEHFSRLKHWGFNTLRFLITWEAIEHAGPGEYDTAFIDYIEKLLKIAGEHGFYVFIDPHQDCWSRMTGGDGAPGWTFEKVGIDFTKFHDAGAAWLMQHNYDPGNPKAYPAMTWAQNRVRFGCATLFTLFLGGRDFAPSCVIEGQNVHDYLQSHFIGAFKQVAERTKDMPHVLGFDSFNEPSVGFIGLKLDGSNMDSRESLGYSFTPIDAMLTGSGFTRTVPYWEIKLTGLRETRRDEINPGKISCWLDGCEDIWKREGVWGLDEKGEPVILQNDYFFVKNGREVDYLRDYLSPFICRFAQELRSVNADTVILYEGPAEMMLKGKVIEWPLPENAVNAPHWYDFPTVGFNRFMCRVSYDYVQGRLLLGGRAIRKAFARQMAGLKALAERFSGGGPSVVGEFGLRYDMEKKKAYRKFRDNPHKAWSSHVKALSWYYDALDANLLGSCQWNYNPENNNEWGDLWNLEDFSIFSRDQQSAGWKEDINSGGRAIEGFCRPHFVAVAGTPLTMEFDMKKGTFLFEFDGDASIKAETLIYVPAIQYPDGYDVTVSEGDVERRDEEQLVLMRIHRDGPHTVKISRKAK